VLVIACRAYTVSLLFSEYSGVCDVSDDPVLVEMRAALARSPEVVALRVRVIELLAERGRFPEALAECAVALGRDAGNPRVLELLQQCTAAMAGAAPDGGTAVGTAEAGTGETAKPAPPGAVSSGAVSSADGSPSSRSTPGFDWAAAENQVSDIVEPAFVTGSPDALSDADVDVVRRSGVTLADVGGMDEVKRQLELTLLGPLRNPELAKAFGTSARGGLLLYGPPGCGKTFVASAIAGELGAAFYPIGISDVLEMYIGTSERNLAAIFDTARRNAPCVLFFDEIDALGHKRSQLHGSSGMRATVNQLLTEMDSVGKSNEGVFVLGATNHPWDIDVALRRPGRFDRMVLVLPPDVPARDAIVRYHLRDRPLSGIDPGAIARRTEEFSGADLAHVCNTATQLAMAESLRTGTVRPITMADIDAALAQIRPSTGPWFESARNVVDFANADGTYDDLAKYIRRRKSR
jgi:SpoVK/Ycf46/Vps4 family AAA+-type ATPase